MFKFQVTMHAHTHARAHAHTHTHIHTHTHTQTHTHTHGHEYSIFADQYLYATSDLDGFLCMAKPKRLIQMTRLNIGL